MKPIFTTLERKRKRVPGNLLRAIATVDEGLGEPLSGLGEAKATDDEFDALTELMDMKDALLAGTLRPHDAVRRVKGMAGAVGAFDKIWEGIVLNTAKMLIEWEKIARRRPKGLHLQGKRTQQFFIHKTTRGDAPSNRPWQLSHGDDVQRRDGPGKVFMPFGHSYKASIRDAFIAAWEDDGPLKVLDIAESLEEAAALIAEAQRVVQVREPRKVGRGDPDPRYDWGDEKGFSEDDRLVLYHGFHNGFDAVLTARHGLSGKDRPGRRYSYEADNNPRGLFVSLDLKTVKEFSGVYGPAVIVEFNAKYSELEAPVWPGGGYTVQGQAAQYFGNNLDKREAARLARRAKAKSSNIPTIATSARPELAATLLGSEFQALFVGDLNPNRVRALWVKDPGPDGVQRYGGSFKRLSRSAFLKQYGDAWKKVDLDTAAGGLGSIIAVNRKTGGFRPADEWDAEKFINHVLKDRNKGAGKHKLTRDEVEEILSSMGHSAYRYVWPKQLPGLKAWQAANESLDEAARMPDAARTNFDSAPYANMRLIDVARLLSGASQQSRPNVALITKLVDRLIHALEFTIYSIQGRPEGRRIGSLIRKAFTALTVNAAALAMGERRDVLGQTTRLNETIEMLELGPVEMPAR